MELTNVELEVDQRILVLQCAALLIEDRVLEAAMLMDRIGAGLGYKAHRAERIAEVHAMSAADKRIWNSLTNEQRAALDAMERNKEVTVHFGPELMEPKQPARPPGRPKGSKNKKRVWVNGKLRLESEVQHQLNLNIQANAHAEDVADAVQRYADALKGETL